MAKYFTVIAMMVLTISLQTQKKAFCNAGTINAHDIVMVAEKQNVCQPGGKKLFKGKLSPETSDFRIRKGLNLRSIPYHLMNASD